MALAIKVEMGEASSARARLWLLAIGPTSVSITSPTSSIRAWKLEAFYNRIYIFII